MFDVYNMPCGDVLYVSKISLIIFGVFSSVCGVMVSFCSQQFIKLEYRKIVLHCIYVECFNGHKIGKCYLIRKKVKLCILVLITRK